MKTLMKLIRYFTDPALDEKFKTFKGVPKKVSKKEVLVSHECLENADVETCVLVSHDALAYVSRNYVRFLRRFREGTQFKHKDTSALRELKYYNPEVPDDFTEIDCGHKIYYQVHDRGP